MIEKYHKKYFNSILEGLNKIQYYENGCLIEADLFYNKIQDHLKNIKIKDHKLFFFGNGASSAFANHMALDFAKNGRISSRSLSDSALITALSNDFSFEEALIEYLKIEGVNKDDFIITISSSGNSQNIVNVLSYCKNNSINTLALSGLNKQNMSILNSKYSIYVPMKTYGVVECIHQIILHSLLDESMGIMEWDKIESQNMNHSNFKL